MEKELNKRRRLFFAFITFTLCCCVLSWAAYAQLKDSAERSFIVIMKNGNLNTTEAAVNRAPLISQLRQAKVTKIKEYKLVNSMAVTVSSNDVEQMLRTNPDVALVIPDSIIHYRRHQTVPRRTGAQEALTSPPLNTIPGSCGQNGAVLLEPEALDTTNTNSDAPNSQTARSLGYTGAGVKVAYIADGIDTNNINFIRKDGKSAFIDYQDFSGDPVGTPTGGDEAFVDANAMIGQGIHVYDLNNFSAQNFASPCNVRIEGMAPGASAVGLKTFSQNFLSPISNFLQAIDYAATVAHVDVLNESFGNTFFPDSALDALKIFDEAAVKAGVTVVASSGDAGPSNTIGGPASDPLVISVGASTTFRFYAQSNAAAARYFASTGWLNDNISGFSSAGFSQMGRTISLVAPGDLTVASCDATSAFSQCTNYLNQPSPTEQSGGTSLSSPLTAGAAALVIEAYRKFHHGASPKPALIQKILTSTATDLGVPANEQGAGLVNSYKAVLLAQSIDNGNSTPPPNFAQGGLPLLISESQLNGVGAAGASYAWPVTVTNTTSQMQLVKARGKTFGPAENIQTGKVTLSDTGALQFANNLGVTNNYATFTFTVPKGQDRLNGSIAYPGNPANGNNARVRLNLIDPQGRFAATSAPQGVGNYGFIDVRKPTAGTWTGVIYSDVSSAGGTNGTVPWQISTQKFVSFGYVLPAHFSLPPGQSETVWVTASSPPAAGDSSGSIVFTSSVGGKDKYVGTERNSVPVTLRSLINVNSGGSFNGVLTGGNGRPPGQGQINYFQFKVEPNHKSITANVALTSDVANSVGAYLVNPDGLAVGYGQNSLNGKNSLQLTASSLNPEPGLWTLIVEFASPVVGDILSQTFTGNIALDESGASAPQLPNSVSTELPAGVAVTVPVMITNNGLAPRAYFFDARLNSMTTLPMAAVGMPAGVSNYPLPNPGNYFPLWMVPTQTSALQASATANVPVEFDFGCWAGDPDLFGAPTAPQGQTYNAGVSYAPHGGIVSQGYWNAMPDEIGPYKPQGEPTGLVSMTLLATTKAFDPAVTSATGDLWLSATNPAYAALAPVTINPGQTTTVNVVITPSGPSGTVVNGTLYVDEVVSSVPPYASSTGNEVTALPYAYKIK